MIKNLVMIILKRLKATTSNIVEYELHMEEVTKEQYDAPIYLKLSKTVASRTGLPHDLSRDKTRIT